MITSSFPRFEGDFFGPWVLEYCRELISQGATVTIVAPQSEGHNSISCEDDRLKLVYFQYIARANSQKLVSPPGMIPNLKSKPLLLAHIPPLLLSYYKEVGKVLAENSFDVVHCQWAIPSGFIGSLLSKKYDLPLVVSTLGAELYLPRFHPFSFFTRFVLKRCQMLIAVSEQMRERAWQYGIMKEKVRVLPNTVNPSRFILQSDLGFKSKFNIPQGHKVILSIRRLVKEKRVDDLLDAFCAVEGDVTLVVGGDGPLRKSLELKASDLGISDRVHFLGYLSSSDLPYYYANSDIYVLSSQQEGLSISLLESMAAGLVAVSTGSTGGGDLIRDGENGFLYPVGDQRGLVKILNEVLKMSKEETAAIGKRAQETIAGGFSNKYVIGEWLKIYQSLLPNKEI